ncbi:MAG: ATP-grasp domain-containing protein [Micrococcales bacterium]|nr:ATP-grasp domain-containing protein [Micrococcales bacterium]
MPLTTVLIANRGEIAVRVARACRDAGLRSVAVYAEPDRHALHVRLADSAYCLGGARPADTYLDAAKLLDVARRAGADAVHPGYGFLAENAAFAQAVIDAGLVWIGPPPAAIRALGDKVSARAIAARVGAPLVPGTPQPVADVAEIHAFAARHGLPLAVKAAYGGGGRGLKVARTTQQIDEAYASAVREATVAFGRGECFVERYLDRPRHVETQCLADAHGGVVVVSTRDCSLQRRHQKLVEEAPAPYLTAEQERTLVDSSVALLREAGYVGAGTCEFLLGADGTVSFLEVNTRLQVEHPVSEEVTGVDLVGEQLRIAAGEPLGYDHLPARGHCIELRINGEDPAVGFLPAPGKITTLRLPGGPGVRVDSGVVEGDTICGAFDSLLLKLIVTGADRRQAVARARRALDELVVEGVATVAPFHQAVLDDPAFVPDDDAPFAVHTRWIEEEFADRLPGLATPTPPEAESDEPELERVVVEVSGKRLEVVLPAALGARGTANPRPRPAIRRAVQRAGGGGNALTSPMQGTIVTVAVADGAQVAAGDLVAVLEAMKMEQPLVAHRAGTVANLSVQPGAGVSAGCVICEITD